MGEPSSRVVVVVVVVIVEREYQVEVPIKWSIRVVN